MWKSLICETANSRPHAKSSPNEKHRHCYLLAMQCTLCSPAFADMVKHSLSLSTHLTNYLGGPVIIMWKVLKSGPYFMETPVLPKATVLELVSWFRSAFRAPQVPQPSMLDGLSLTWPSSSTVSPQYSRYTPNTRYEPNTLKNESLDRKKTQKVLPIQNLRPKHL